MLRRRLFRYFFRKYYLPRLSAIVAPDYPILLDYPVKTTHRYGYGKPPHQQLAAMLEAGRNEYVTRLTRFCSLKDFLRQIPEEATQEAVEPCWDPSHISTASMRSRSTACLLSLGQRILSRLARDIRRNLPGAQSVTMR